MANDPMEEFKDAEKEIAARKRNREQMLIDHRPALALEQISDELLLLRMEARMLRYAVATAGAMLRR